MHFVSQFGLMSGYFIHLHPSIAQHLFSLLSFRIANISISQVLWLWEKVTSAISD